MSDQAAVKTGHIPTGPRRRIGKMRDDQINLAHGSGGKAMRELIEDVFLGAFDNPVLAAMEDQAVFPLSELARHGDRLAFTTETFVVDPLFFPGGDIGTLAVAGTINDLSMSGAVPLYISCAMVLEEGLSVDSLAPDCCQHAANRAAAGRDHRHRRHQGRRTRRRR